MRTSGPGGERVSILVRQDAGGLTSVPDLATFLNFLLDGHVVDKTGLTNRYEIDLTQFVPADLLESRTAPHAEKRAEPPDFFPSVRRGLEQLGLTLEVKKTPTDVLVVDHVESAP
jgi:uncharacterized protein (TIGR03435 family)